MARTALVTGASRGIGKATALALADAGFDVAVTARTLREGEGRDDSDVGHGKPVPGSLESTVAEVEKRGRRSLPVVADLLDPAAPARIATTVLEQWEHIDVLVNNAVHTGPGSMLRFLDTDLAHFRTKVEANYLAQVALIQAVLPSMVEHGGGTVVNVTSYSGYNDPPGPVGKGGWGLAYSASKGAFHRIAGILAVEHRDDGIRAFNVDPGHVVTERAAANSDELGLTGHYEGAPPSAPAAAIAWLATSAAADELNGTTVNGLRIALREAGHPDWRHT